MFSLSHSKTIIILFGLPPCQSYFFAPRCLITVFDENLFFLISVETRISFWWIDHFISSDSIPLRDGCLGIPFDFILSYPFLFFIKRDNDFTHLCRVSDLTIPGVFFPISWVSTSFLKVVALMARFKSNVFWCFLHFDITFNILPRNSVLSLQFLYSIITV